MFAIPWYAILLISIPQMYLVISIGFCLFKLKSSAPNTLIAATIVGILSYFTRKFVVVPGINTIILLLAAATIMYLLSRVNMWKAVLAVLLGAVVLGVIETLILPFAMSGLGLTVADLGLKPWMNILVTMPILLVALIILLVINKTNFVLFDLGNLKRK